MSNLYPRLENRPARRIAVARTLAAPHNEPLWPMLATVLLLAVLAAALVALRTWAWLPATVLP